MRLLLLSRYQHQGATSRVRHYQFVPSLQAAGIDVTIVPFFDEDYLTRLYQHGHRSLRAYLTGAIARVVALGRLRRFDAVWIESELFPWMPAIAERMLAQVGIPYVAEYDDALFHRYDGHSSWVVRRVLGGKISSVMRHAAVVVAGNEYIAAHARASGARRVEVVPSVVDTRRYGVSAGSPADPDQFTIGWIGSPITARYLVRLAPIFRDLCICPGTKLRLIGAGPRLRLPDTVRVESRPWRYDDEIEALAGCDVGIMPLEDGPWEQGKCGYKLLQYMASGKPVVATPVGVNRDIVRDGENGFLATSLDEWRTALTRLRDDESLRHRLGEAGRRRVERDYSLASVAPRVTAIFRSLCGGHWAGPRP